MNHRWTLLIGLALLAGCSWPAGLTAPSAAPTTVPALPSPTPASTVSPTAPPTEAPTSTPVVPVISAANVGQLRLVATFGMGEVVRSLSFSPDGQILASAAGNNQDFVIRLWRVDSQQPMHGLEGHSDIVWDVAFSPDGMLLASASKDHTLRVWDWQSGEQLQVFELPDEVTSVAFAPDGQILAAGGVVAFPDAAIWMWSVGTWSAGLELAEFWNVTALGFSPNGQTIAGGGTSRNVRLWDSQTGAELAVLYHPGQVLALDYSIDGHVLATGLCAQSAANQCTQGAVRLWQADGGTLIDELGGFPDWVTGVVFTPDGSALAAGSRDGSLRIIRVSDRAVVFETHIAQGISTLALSSDGRTLAVGTLGPEIHTWRIGP